MVLVWECLRDIMGIFNHIYTYIYIYIKYDEMHTLAGKKRTYVRWHSIH